MHHTDPKRLKITYPHLVLFILLLSLGIWGLCQTECVISRFFTRPGGIERIRGEMKADREVQLKINQRYCDELKKKNKPCVVMGQQAGDGIEINGLFSKRQKAMLEAVKRALLSDATLRMKLEEKFGTNLQELDAVIIPAWDMLDEKIEDDLGITERTREMYKDAVDDPDYDAFTARDHVEGEGFTKDGRPRIILNRYVFASFDRLKAKLFHEALHALNVPKHDVSAIRHDLFYLQEYRETAKLVGWEDSYDEFRTWLLFVITPIFLSILAFRRAFRYAL